MLESIKRSYAAHYEARVEFLIAFQNYALLLAPAFILSFIFVGSYGSAAGTSLFLLGLFVSIYWRKQGKAFLASCWLAVTFLIEPTTAITLSQGVESPYVVWLIVPIFAAGGLLGAQGALLAAASAILTYTTLFLLHTTLIELNELPQKYYDFMYFLSFSSAALFTSILAWIAIAAIERDSISAQASAAQSTLAAEDLRHTEGLLRQELYERDKLYAVISHELRTPAATLKMMFDEHVMQHLNSPERSSINDTLEHMLSVMEDMRLAREPEQLNKTPRGIGILSETVSQAAKMAERFTADSGLSIQTSVTRENEIPVSIPKQLIRQITINLVKNCAVHADASVLNITLDWTEGAGEVQYSVKFSDDGCGVGAEHIPTLFDAFARADSDADGSGIGLNVCKEYAQKALGGDLIYQPSPMGGAEFVLTAVLPIAVDSPQSTSETLSEDVLKDSRLLLVEDSEILRKLSAKMLSKKGAYVTEAADGLEAMKLFGSTHFDAVVTDLHMPNMSGIELTKSLRGLGYTLPIIGLTAAFGEESKLLEKAGTDDILIKPLAIDRLERTLSALNSQKVGEKASNHRRRA